MKKKKNSKKKIIKEEPKEIDLVGKERKRRITKTEKDVEGVDFERFLAIQEKVSPSLEGKSRVSQPLEVAVEQEPIKKTEETKEKDPFKYDVGTSSSSEPKYATLEQVYTSSNIQKDFQTNAESAKKNMERKVDSALRKKSSYSNKAPEPFEKYETISLSRASDIKDKEDPLSAKEIKYSPSEY